MKTLIVILVSLLSLCIVSPVFAVDNFISLEDLTNLSDQSKKDFVNKKMKEWENANTTTTNIIKNIDIDKAEEWAKLISGTIKTICKDLSIEVNDFIKTDVGKITLFVIIYKVMGEDIKNIFFGSIAWIIMTLILGISFRYFHTKKKVKVKNDKGHTIDIKYVTRYEWSGGIKSESKALSTIVHVVMFALTCLVCALIIA